MRTIKIFIFFVLVLSLSCTKRSVFNDKNAAVEDRVEDLLKQMTLDEKIEQLSGDPETGFDTPDNDRLGVPGFNMSDGPLGVRWNRSTAFPCGASVGASWDTTLVAKFGEALAKEALAKGRNLLLGPCVNIHRFPSGGRNFESYGEDPFLTSRLAVSYIKALQTNGVIACIKHYALNNQEWKRTEIDVKADERTMREIYLPSFEAAVKEAGVYSVMSAYNKVNGFWCSENEELLTKILKNEWGFKGIVISDWESTHNTILAANNGLDIEMPSAVIFTPEKLKEAIKSGKVTEETINEKVRRILRVKFASGIFDMKEGENKLDTTIFHSNAHKKLALEMAVNSMVLLKNKNLLPLDINTVKKIALIGPLTKNSPTGGGGSSHVSPYYNISPFEGISEYVKDKSNVVFALGSVLPLTPVVPVPVDFLSSEGKPGLKAEFFNNMELNGKPVFTRRDPIIDFSWNDIPPIKEVGSDNFSIIWTGNLKAPETREYTFFTASDDGVKLYIDNKLIIDNWSDHGTTIDSAKYNMVAGKEYQIKLEYYENGGSEIIQFGWDYKSSKQRNNLLAEAIKAAKSADVAILFVGTTEYIESEGYDRTGNLKLLSGQEELIKSVAAANPKTIVVMFSGTPVLTGGWLDKVPALVQAFFPGQEGGNAIAKLLFGEENFSGKLPFSYLASYDQTPAYKGYMDPSLIVPYSEGIYVGYRYLDKNNLKPAFSFGHGLSYTTFQYSDLEISKSGELTYNVNLKLKNTGKREGKEVVQVYVAPKRPLADRPVKELKAFAKIELKPGEQQMVTLKLNKRSFSRFDVNKKDWVIDPGRYEVLVGASSSDIKITGEIVL